MHDRRGVRRRAQGHRHHADVADHGRPRQGAGQSAAVGARHLARQRREVRRFARLLVSEIKLYNEQKVKEGRESSDLYERLREAIDRSREMYDKRVQPPVASKFDYFNYELVFTLAEGDEARLGGSYPGASI